MPTHSSWQRRRRPIRHVRAQSLFCALLKSFVLEDRFGAFQAKLRFLANVAINLAETKIHGGRGGVGAMRILTTAVKYNFALVNRNRAPPPSPLPSSLCQPHGTPPPPVSSPRLLPARRPLPWQPVNTNVGHIAMYDKEQPVRVGHKDTRTRIGKTVELVALNDKPGYKGRAHLLVWVPISAPLQDASFKLPHASVRCL